MPITRITATVIGPGGSTCSGWEKWNCRGRVTGRGSSKWLPERKGQDPEFEAFLAEAFLAGLSTRDLARISEKHLGQKYDSKQVSRIVREPLPSWKPGGNDA